MLPTAVLVGAVVVADDQFVFPLVSYLNLIVPPEYPVYVRLAVL